MPGQHGAGLAATTAVLGANPANAASNYTASVTGPTIYQSNYPTKSPTIASYASVGKITSINYSWGWAYSASPPNLQVQLCVSGTTRCADISGFASGTTTRFAGEPVSSSFHFVFNSVQSTTKVYNPPYYGTTNQVTVFYS